MKKFWWQTSPSAQASNQARPHSPRLLSVCTLQLERDYSEELSQTRRALDAVQPEHKLNSASFTTLWTGQFLSAVYIVNKMFIPIGPSVAPANDVERVACLLIMLSGCLVVTGAAVASLSLVISLYMRPEETFRARYRLIMKEMRESHMPASQREKVETFYRMYWHKQRAVSATQLLPTFPPTLPAEIFTDIYFEATQKSRILQDLSYHFLSELAKKMETMHYIPGDAIIKRSSRKSSIIFITYGDIEMLTAEDDSTAILRMTRGTILSPCGAVAAAGCGRAHLEIRAATFCTAHVLKAADLWRVALKYGRNSKQTAIILDTFNEHLERVKRHYSIKIPEDAKYKSSILRFKRCLLDLMEARDTDGNLLLARTDVFLEVAGCYIMRNRADATLSNEVDAICLRTTFPCILQPSSSLQFAWHFFMAVLIVAVCLIHPYFLVFKETIPIEFRCFDYAVTLIYIVDHIVHLSTGANVEEGVPITFSQTSSQQIRSHWFVLDVMGTVPIFEFIGDGHFAGINKILRLPKVFRVLKNIEEMCVYHSSTLRFFSYTLLLLLACYLIAALQQGFMCFQFGYCKVTNITHSPYWQHLPHDDATIESRIKFGLYWAISMITFTTHMETWGAQNWNNVLYTMFVLEICIVLRIFMEAVYSATIMVTTVLREDFDACISNVKNLLIRNEVDPMLRKRFITYLELCWYTDKAYSMTNKRKSIFHDLPPHVYQDIVARQRSKYLLCIPFMKFLYKEDLKNVSANARVFYTSPNEILLNTGDITNEMYVIKQGICEIISPDTKTSVGLLTVKNHFGVLVCLLRLPAFYTIRAVTHVQVFSISRKHLLKAIDIPKIKDAIDFAKEQPRSPLRAGWLRQARRRVRGVATHLRLRHKAPLYIFPRFTIRPDGNYLLWYEWFRAFCAVVSSIIYPCYSYMVLQWHWLYYLAWLLDISAYFDIFQRMLVGYFNEQGILIYHPASTAAHYIKGPFIVDLFGCLPLEFLESTRNVPFDHNRFQVTEMEQFLMLNRLIQLYRLPSAMLVLTGYIERRDVTIVLNAIPLFIALTNVMTCFMVFYSTAIYYTIDYSKWFIEPYNDNGGSWLHLFGKAFRFNLTESPWNLHLSVYFWVVYETSTTGYNSFKPSNFAMMEVLIIGMITSTMIITYFLVRIISIRANVNKALAAFQEHMKDMVVYMKREKLEKDLQLEILSYYEYNWDKMGGVDYSNVLKLCDQITLRSDAIIHIYGPTFAKVFPPLRGPKHIINILAVANVHRQQHNFFYHIILILQCPILAHCDMSLLRLIGREIRTSYFLRGMCVVEVNDVISDMYFVASGSVDVRETEDNMSSVYKLYMGSVFGNLDGSEKSRCPVAFVASSKLHLLMINSQAFHQIITDFPVVYQLLQKYRKNDSMNYIMGSMTDSLKLWKEQSLTSIKSLRRRRGFVKRLYYRDNIFLLYLIFISMGCIYTDVYNAGFQDNRLSVVIALYLMDFGFILKIVAHCLAPYIVRDYRLNEFVKPLRSLYFKGEFKYDLISILPFEALCLFSVEHKWLLFSWLRLNRMFRIGTVYRCLKRLHERVTINLILTTVFSVLVWFTLFVHTTACIWYFIGVMEDDNEPNSSWIHNDSGGSWCTSLYVCSLYFVLTTFTQNGVGEILPKNRSEVLFVSILQILSTMIYMIYVGEFSNIIQYRSFRSFSFYSKYLELQEFLKNTRVSKNLVSIVNKYCLHLWRESRGVQEPYFLKTAPLCLRLRIMSAAYLHHLKRHYIFEDCEAAFLRQLVGCLQFYTYNEDMYVVKQSDITDSMYFVHTGRVQESTDDGESAPRTYPAGSYFGVMQGLVHNLPYNHSYRTKIKSQVLTLRLDDWIYLLKHFPISRETIYKHMSGPGTDNSRPSVGNLYGPEHKPPKGRRKLSSMDRSSQSGPYLPLFNLSPGANPADQATVPSQVNNWSLDSRVTENISLGSKARKSDDEARIFQEQSSIPTQSATISSNYNEATPESKLVSEMEQTMSELTDEVAIKANELISDDSSPTITELPRHESSEVDTLQLAEDEQATKALTIQLSKKEKYKDQYKSDEVNDKSSAESIKDEEMEEHVVTVDMSQSKDIIHVDTQAEDIKSDAERDESMALVSYEKKKEGTVEDQATSTAKLNRRFVHVRYEEDENQENKEDKVKTRVKSMILDESPVEGVADSIAERNLRTMDSDLIEVQENPENNANGKENHNSQSLSPQGLKSNGTSSSKKKSKPK
ncbi:hypothetical protein K1T71_002275 [Dendrolimus kikuchii]|uniref:Uncharacterized protein n=1 Tax=Dendrolimus kikuchii TaxID=765133 RepID=A0ACC1DC84_9NEOP|nr:hypothetical protein K1T71_002275 [Dendrolimus kikuchii]